MSKMAGDPAAVLESVQAVAHLMRSRQLQVLRGGEDDVTPLESRVLFYFARHPGGTLGDLAEHAGRDKGQLGRLLGGLRERGWLRSEIDPDDRRVVRLFLTDEALEREHAMLGYRKALAAAAVRGLTSAERQQLVALLERVRVNLQEAASA